MKFGQVIECNKRSFFLQESCKKDEDSSRPLFFLKKALYEVKTSSLELNFNIF